MIEPGIKTFKLDIEGKTETITVDRLKPARLELDSPMVVAQPRPRGRPRGSSSYWASEPAKVKQSFTTDLPHHTRSGRLLTRPHHYIPFPGGV